MRSNNLLKIIIENLAPTIESLTLYHSYYSHLKEFKKCIDFSALQSLPTHIKELNLSSSDIGYSESENLIILGEILPSHLESLILIGNHLGDTKIPECFLNFIKSLSELKSLKKLSLWDNDLDELSCEMLCQILIALENVKTLTHLNLGANYLEQTRTADELYSIINTLPKQITHLCLVGIPSYELYKKYSENLVPKEEAIKALLESLTPERQNDYYKIASCGLSKFNLVDTIFSSKRIINTPPDNHNKVEALNDFLPNP